MDYLWAIIKTGGDELNLPTNDLTKITLHEFQCHFTDGMQ